MIIRFIGDVHCHWLELQQIIDQSAADIFIQVGDMGLKRPTVDIPSFSTDRPFLFIDGNNDNYTALLDNKFKLPRNVAMVPRATLLTIDDYNILFMGGAKGTPSVFKSKGLDWFPETEQPSEIELTRFLELLPEADIIVTHCGPQWFQDIESELELFYLESRKLVKDGAMWVFGHFHPEKTMIKTINGVKYMCLRPVWSSVK